MHSELPPSGAPPTSADERYRPLFALSPQPAWVYDRASLRFLEVNEAAVQHYGWSREEFLAMTIRDIRPPSANRELDVMLANTEGVARHSAITSHRTRAGRTLNVEISSYPLDFLGRAARMVLVHDVTDRDVASRALAASEEKYRTVIEQLRDVFFRIDTDGLWTFLNQAWTTLTGHPVESTLGTGYLASVHPSDRRLLLDAMGPLLNGEGDSAVVEARYFHRDGGYRRVEVSIYLTRDESGVASGTMGTLRDVTERRAARDERQRLETHIRQLLDASSEGIYGLDAEGIITFINSRGSGMLGYDAAELIGQPMHQTVHYSRTDGSPYPLMECPIYRAVREGIPCEASDEVMWRKDGSSIQVEYVVSPLREGSRLSGAVINLRDITARRQAELELIVARDAAEAASRAKSDFLARMSHELRTPLNSIIGFANVLGKNKPDTMTHDQLSWCNRIATNGLHLLGLINDILDLSKIEAGRMTLELSEVPLDVLVRATVDELEGQTRDRPVLLRATVPEGLQPLLSDAARMKQVLINLIGNALKFTERGEVNVVVEADARGRPTLVTVRDTGIGIPADRLDAIFSVFEQAESTTSRRFGGTGLGLAISRSLCELMGHHLDAQSIEGVGTTMTVRLGTVPVTSPRLTPALGSPVITREFTPSDPLAMSEREGPLALVVDDDPDARLLLGQLITEEGCRVVVADSGIEALSLARELMPAIIFLDLRLPKISGFDVLRILRADEALQNTPVIIVSVVGKESFPSLVGAAEILDKPVSREQVVAILERWIPGWVR